jgi:hypothetical protein
MGESRSRNVLIELGEASEADAGAIRDRLQQRGLTDPKVLNFVGMKVITGGWVDDDLGPLEGVSGVRKVERSESKFA